MKPLFLCLLGACLVSACSSRGSDPSPLTSPDSLCCDTLSPLTDSVAVEAPRGADGLFDDFAYTFMHNAAFQLSRIKFPLTNRVNGHDAPIARSAWKHDKLYAGRDAYTLLFDSERSIAAEKDTALSHVVVEWVDLQKKQAKQYLFNKERGRWLLTAIDRHPLADNENSSFYAFYHRFSSDLSYQKRHIANPFAFSTYDPDTYQRIDGVLDAAQWVDFRPELPTGTITNINYGQSYANSQVRVFMLCSVSGGMGCSLVFKKKGNEWLLTKLEN